VCHGTHVLLSQQIPQPHGSFLAMSPQHICTLLCSCQAMLSTRQVPRHTPSQRIPRGQADKLVPPATSRRTCYNTPMYLY
jgi:hypothetical protein